jgi:2',3'-cyclic-nucleotide 2'-phosphodiesterase (5'-nucleotidase family)
MKKLYWALMPLLALSGCVPEDNPVEVVPVKPEKSIVILYENDVHCGIDGYSKMRGLRDAIVRADTSYVAMLSAGDFLQGDLAGALSTGQYIVDIMKNMGYDAITLGNHEFDYGVPRLQELLPKIGTNVVCSNLF